VSGRLHIEAIAEATIAAAGNRNPAGIALCVTDEQGAPVTGIGVAELRVDAMIVGAGGVPVRVVEVAPGRLPGTYLAQVMPIKEETWKPGGHVFAVAVEVGGRRGATLARVVLE
jgi:hypothetical protein